MHDVAIIGSGPAGLQSAIFTASEGLKTAVFTGPQVGGQIHDTPKLENFAGQNSRGISGPEFINSMLAQCKSFGVNFISETVGKLDNHNGWLINSRHVARSVIVASGYRYKEPKIEGLHDHLNSQAFLGPFRCMSCPRGLTYCVVGGGNSAGQAILSLAEHAKRVYVITRSGVGMSQYLVERIKAQRNITIKVDLTPHKMDVKSLHCSDGKEYNADFYFFCIGGTPNTDFIPKHLLDNTGHVKINESLEAMPGMYAIGDVRVGVRRHSVGSCIGDAATATAHLHEYLRSGKAPKIGG
jgi:thioredoxin reductase (NADPH)